MAGAIINGIKDSGMGINVIGSEIDEQIAKSVSERLGIEVITDNIKLAQLCNVIFIATKPNQVINVLTSIKPYLTREKLLVSIAAGITTETIESLLTDSPVIRIMPNTPALIKQGMFGICAGKYALDTDLEKIKGLLTPIGKCIAVEENQMDIVTAISGSGPAFFYQIIENIAHAGEKLGLDYEKSLLLTTQTALGSAQMIFNRGETSVQALIDNVATKGGCTFVGIEEMKNNKTDKIFYSVIEKTTKKACELGK